MRDEDILKEIDSLAVGDIGSIELLVYGQCKAYPKICVRTENFRLVSDDVYVSNDDRIWFKRNGKTFRGKLREIVSNFKFKRVK